LLPDHNLLKNIKGFIDQDEGKRLYDIALEAGKLGPCLEIGSYCGKSTIYLGTACRKTGTILFSIDHHRGSEEQQPGQEYFDSELFDSQTGCIDTFKEFRKTIETKLPLQTTMPGPVTSFPEAIFLSTISLKTLQRAVRPPIIFII